MLATINITSLQNHGQATTFTYTDPFGRSTQGILLNWNGQFHAYRNLCPHQSLPLDGDTDQFFDPAKSVLVCQAHGARFDPATGECIMGPCLGQHLQPLRVEFSDDGESAIVRRGGGLSL